MPSEDTTLQAVKNRLMHKKELALRQVQRLEQQIAALESIRGTLSGEDNGEIGTDDRSTTTSGRVPISSKLVEYLNQTGKKEFTAADVSNYIKLEYPQVSYNSVYETLGRQVKAGKLRKPKDSEKFEVI